MKNSYHPILFSTPMVKATLGDIKEVTRRTQGLEEININPNDWQFEWADFSLKYPWRFTQISSLNEKSLSEKNFYQAEAKCKYGKVGDILWVRETFHEDKAGYLYKADYSPEALRIVQTNPITKMKWKPSIFMPKDACRLFLEITSIKVKRLHDISEEDAIKEGAKPCSDELSMENRLNNYNNPSNATYPLVYVVGFKNLWKSINGEASWNLNPWVWVIGFKKVERPADFN